MRTSRDEFNFQSMGAGGEMRKANRRGGNFFWVQRKIASSRSGAGVQPSSREGRGIE